MFSELQDFIDVVSDPHSVIFCVFISGVFIGQCVTFLGAVVEELYYLFLHRKRKHHDKKSSSDDYS